METYYYIGGDDVAGILPMKIKRYDNLEEAQMVLEQLLDKSNIDKSLIQWRKGESRFNRTLTEVDIYEKDRDEFGFRFYDYGYWITKKTIQPIYIVLNDNKDIDHIFPTESRANHYLDRLAYDSRHSWTIDDRDGKPRLQLFGTNGVVLASYWVKRYEVEIYE